MMKVPLTVILKGSRLLVTRNSETVEVTHPFRPYITACDPRRDMRQDVPYFATKTKFSRHSIEEKKRIPLGEKILVDKFEFEDEFNTRIEKARMVRNYRMLTYNLPYITQVCIDKPDFMYEYSNSNPLKTLVFDIEVRTRGKFPSAKKDPIISIGYQKIVGEHEEEPFVIENYDKTAQCPDRMILKDFKVMFEAFDPDVIVGYNNRIFDIPYMVKRYQANKHEPVFLSRYDLMEEDRDRKKKRIWTAGRVIFDCYDHALADQTLMGIENKRMKTVGRWFKFPGIIDMTTDEMRNTEKLIGTQQLRDYQLSDVNITRSLFKMYFPKAAFLADQIGLPLSMVAIIRDSILSEVLCGRQMTQMGYWPVDDNRGRYHPWYSKRLGKGHLGKEWIKFQAAVVECPRPGRYDKVWKADYKSFYPSIIISANLSPETVKITDFKPLNDDDVISFKRVDNRVLMSIPDKNFGSNIHLEIDMSKKGFLAEIEKNYLEKRAELRKKEDATTDEGEKAQYKSMQHAYKVLGNCFHPNTEIVTEDGIKLLKDVNVGDIVYSINKSSGIVEKKPITHTYKYIYKGPLVCFSGKKMKLRVTPEHKMLRQGYKGRISYKKASEYLTNAKLGRTYFPIHKKMINRIDDTIVLGDYITEPITYYIQHGKTDLRNVKRKLKKLGMDIKIRQFKTKKGFSKVKDTLSTNNIRKIHMLTDYRIYMKSLLSNTNIFPAEVNTKQFSKFIGYYLSEGCLSESRPKTYLLTKRGVCRRVNINQHKACNPDIYNDIEKTIHDMPIDGYNNIKVWKTDKNIDICSYVFYDVILSNCGKKKEKNISKKLYKKLNKEELFKGLYLGDGTKGKNLYTTSENCIGIRDIVVRLLIEMGYAVTCRHEADNEKQTGYYRITWNNNKRKVSTKNISTEVYSGDVFNVTVKDNNTILAGENGRFIWTGQSAYGANGTKTVYFGDLGVAIAIAGIARWAIMDFMRYIGDDVIEVDTDGIYVNGKPDVNKYLKSFHAMFKEKFGRDDVFKVDMEEFNEGYFYKAKNYILKDGDKIIYHGATMKSSTHFPGYQRALKALSVGILDNKDVKKMYKEETNFAKWSLDDFVRKVTVGKNPEEYDIDTNSVSKLCNQSQEVNGSKPAKGDQIEYIVTSKDIFSESQDLMRRYMAGENVKKPVGDSKYYTLRQLVDSQKDVHFGSYIQQLGCIRRIFGIEDKKETEFIRCPILNQPIESFEITKDLSILH